MNDRMLELAIQAGLKKPHASDREYIGDFDWRLFGELVVNECLSDLKERIAIRYQGSDKDCDIGYGMEIVYWEIVDKFGVEV